MSEPNKVIRTDRQIIEHKLMVALEDPGCVAALFSRQDLEDLLFALATKNWNPESVRGKRVVILFKGFEQLLKEAFP